MPADDLIHESVKNDLVKEGWTILANSFVIILAFHPPNLRGYTDFAVA